MWALIFLKKRFKHVLFVQIATNRLRELCETEKISRPVLYSVVLAKNLRKYIIEGEFPNLYGGATNEF